MPASSIGRMPYPIGNRPTSGDTLAGMPAPSRQLPSWAQALRPQNPAVSSPMARAPNQPPGGQFGGGQPIARPMGPMGGGDGTVASPGGGDGSVGFGGNPMARPSPQMPMGMGMGMGSPIGGPQVASPIARAPGLDGSGVASPIARLGAAQGPGMGNEMAFNPAGMIARSPMGQIGQMGGASGSMGSGNAGGGMDDSMASPGGGGMGQPTGGMARLNPMGGGQNNGMIRVPGGPPPPMGGGMRRPGGPPNMGRPFKKGGPVPDMKGGAGGGLGRLQKAKDAAKGDRKQK